MSPDKKGLYCSSCVEEENWRYRPDTAGEGHPRWSGGTQELECNECGAVFEREQRSIYTERVFCDPECQSEWVSDAFTGEGHPNWKGGGDANYGKGWRRARSKTLERDGYEWVVCGTSREDLGRNPDVHHIVPVCEFVERPVTTERDAHYLENLVSLCIDCHRKAEFDKLSAKRLQLLARGASLDHTG